MRRFNIIALCMVALFGLYVVGDSATGRTLSSQIPQPDERDQITHNRGNLLTTVQNWGYIGGYWWANLPSGRWPANSTNDYLAEMKFWMGGIDPAGDTLLANTDDDFRPIPTLVSGAGEFDIRLSTDTGRYDYDASDTVGTGIGFPAYGWRVWDNQVDQWTYNKVFDNIDSLYVDGGPVSVQESICRFADDGKGTPLMGLEITQTVRQWDNQLLKDILMIQIDIKNAGTTDYTNFAFGLYCDFDVGGPDGSGENGRLGDLVAFDSSLSLAWTYDEDDFDPGWGPAVIAGRMGTVIISTPGDVGMTSFNTGQWEYLPQTDAGRYSLIDNTDYDQSLPPADQYYIQSVRGINLPAGEVVTFVFALVAAQDDDGLREMAQRAVNVYDHQFISPSAPNDPVLTATPGDKAVKLMWDTGAELSVDKQSRLEDFRGYKVYRSTDQGATWGAPITTKLPDDIVGPPYVPLRVVEADDYGRFAHTFIDSNLTNGVEYWYSVIAYDQGATGIPPLWSALGSPSDKTNVVKIFPRDDPIGYKTPLETVDRQFTGSASDGSVEILVVDQSQITGDDYQVTFSEDPDFTRWYLINSSTGDTVLADQTQYYGDFGTYPIGEGLQVVVKNPDRMPDTTYQSAFSVPNVQTVAIADMIPFDVEMGGNIHYRSDFEIRFTATGSTGYDWFTAAPIALPFEVWNVTSGQQVGCWILDFGGDGQWTMADADYIVTTDFDYDGGAFHPEGYPYYLNWIIIIDPASTPADNDVLFIDGPDMIRADETFSFSSLLINSTDAKENVDKVRVVPNPYLGYASWETTNGLAKVQFRPLPEICTIRIYTIAGDLVKTLEHVNGTGTEDWNLLTESGQGVASGVYFFHVESQFGEYSGKFAVIR